MPNQQGLAGLQRWSFEEELGRVQPIAPRLASWNANADPAQVALRKYLDEIAAALPAGDGELALRMEIGVPDESRLLNQYDLENYLTPVVARLGPARFRIVSATKRLGGESSIAIGRARPATTQLAGWTHVELDSPGGTGTKAWKVALRAKLVEAGVRRLPDGPVQVQIAWAGSSTRNWVWLWKPTGDAMGPILGEPDPVRTFNIRDDRITELTLHWYPRPEAGHGLAIGFWWRPAR